MTTTTPANPAETTRRVTFGRDMHSEWIKLATVRSTWWSVAITVVLSFVPAVLLAMSIDATGAKNAGVSVAQIVFSTMGMVLLLAGIFGAITATGEYSTGLIRSTLTADPMRGRVLATKIIVVAAFMFIVALVTFTITAIVVSAILSTKGWTVGWDDPGTTIVPLFSVAGGTAAVAVLGLALGFIVRSGAGAIASVVGLLFVLPIIVSLFNLAGEGWAWMQHVAQYLPMALVQRLLLPAEMSAGMIPQWAAALALAAWVAAAVLTAWAVLRARSA